MGETQSCGHKGHTLLLVSIVPGMFPVGLDGTIADTALLGIFELLSTDRTSFRGSSVPVGSPIGAVTGHDVASLSISKSLDERKGPSC